MSNPYLRGQAYRKAEDAYIAARKAGSRASDAALRLDLTATASDAFENAYRYQSSNGHTPDNSCPKFADHDRHLAEVGRQGAYPVMPSMAKARVRA